MEKNPELAAILEVLRSLTEGRKDHETRIRRLEYIIATAIGALAVFKFLIEKHS